MMVEVFQILYLYETTEFAVTQHGGAKPENLHRLLPEEWTE